jgi:hypothetical protein
MEGPVQEQLDLCVDAYVDGEAYDPAALPTPVDVGKASPEELAMAWRRQWQPGQVLRVRFLDGAASLHARVQAHARTWLIHANLVFDFGQYADAEIRISFRGHGYWSLVGTDAMRRPDPAQPTMQLGGFADSSGDTQLRRAVLHEFGHAIGCIHEQASPAAAIPWDEPEVYRFYRQWQGWDDETIYRNVLLRYSSGEARFSNYDPASIMQYPVPNRLTVGDFEIGWNTELSDGDAAFVSRMYPGGPGAASPDQILPGEPGPLG